MTSSERTAPASLIFGSDTEPGIRRRGTKRFTYINQRTGRAASAEDLLRIRALVIPPAWTDVWISADPDSHLQATGRDARGRKQYRYHDAFTAERAEEKFADLVPFGHVLGPLRRSVERDLRKPRLDRDRVVATVVRLLDLTSLRIGNPRYSKENNSFGLTTLRNNHVKVRGSTIHLVFPGKSNHRFELDVDNRRLAKIVRQCQHLPGQHLFEYRTLDGGVGHIGSNDVNAYLSEHAAVGVTAKTFRTWNATVRAAEGFADAAERGEATSARVVNSVIDDVAEHLGNTRTVCRNSYIHPVVLERFVDGSISRSWSRPIGKSPAGLTTAERKTVRLLRTASR